MRLILLVSLLAVLATADPLAKMLYGKAKGIKAFVDKKWQIAKNGEQGSTKYNGWLQRGPFGWLRPAPVVHAPTTNVQVIQNHYTITNHQNTNQNNVNVQNIKNTNTQVEQNINTVYQRNIVPGETLQAQNSQTTSLPQSTGLTNKAPPREGSSNQVQNREYSTNQIPAREASINEVPPREGATSHGHHREGSNNLIPAREGSANPVPGSEGSTNQIAASQGSVNQVPRWRTSSGAASGIPNVNPANYNLGTSGSAGINSQSSNQQAEYSSYEKEKASKQTKSEEEYQLEERGSVSAGLERNEKGRGGSGSIIGHRSRRSTAPAVAYYVTQPARSRYTYIRKPQVLPPEPEPETVPEPEPEPEPVPVVATDVHMTHEHQASFHKEEYEHEDEHNSEEHDIYEEYLTGSGERRTKFMGNGAAVQSVPIVHNNAVNVKHSRGHHNHLYTEDHNRVHEHHATHHQDTVFNHVNSAQNVHTRSAIPKVRTTTSTLNSETRLNGAFDNGVFTKTVKTRHNTHDGFTDTHSSFSSGLNSQKVASGVSKNLFHGENVVTGGSNNPFQTDLRRQQTVNVKNNAVYGDITQRKFMNGINTNCQFNSLNQFTRSGININDQYYNNANNYYNSIWMRNNDFNKFLNKNSHVNSLNQFTNGININNQYSNNANNYYKSLWMRNNEFNKFLNKNSQFNSLNQFTNGININDQYSNNANKYYKSLWMRNNEFNKILNKNSQFKTVVNSKTQFNTGLNAQTHVLTGVNSFNQFNTGLKSYNQFIERLQRRNSVLNSRKFSSARNCIFNAGVNADYNSLATKHFDSSATNKLNQSSNSSFNSVDSSVNSGADVVSSSLQLNSLLMGRTYFDSWKIEHSLLEISSTERLDLIKIGVDGQGKAVWGAPVYDPWGGLVTVLQLGQVAGSLHFSARTIDGHKALVYEAFDDQGLRHEIQLRTARGHLLLVQGVYQGFPSYGILGYDLTGEIFIPLHFQQGHLQLDDTVHSMDFIIYQNVCSRV